MAGLISLGISKLPAPPKRAMSDGQAGRGPDLAEYGASGTPIFGGFLRERGEYNSELIGLSAVETYERMRRGDGQVAATLHAIKLPILAADWNVVLPDDATPAEKEAGEFVRNCLFKDLDFNSVLRNALLMLDFGFSVHEDVWEIVGNRVRLAKLAPRLPLTAYRWITTETGEALWALEQMGYRGAEYVTTQIRANKMDLFVFGQEGQNYTGLSLLRSMYQHWYIKSNLYKVEAIACERNGMGVPTVVMGPDAKKEDRVAAVEWVQKLVGHERTGLVLPSGWSFKLEGVTGFVRDAKDSIAHHNIMISMAGLTMFMQLGQTHGAGRALGDTMADFFYLSLDALSRQISRVLSLGTVKRLVDFNFTGIRRYPVVKAQQILTVKFDAIVDALHSLALAGIMEPDDSLESWMREKIGAPAVDKGTVRPVPGSKGAAGGPGGRGAGGTLNARVGANSGERTDNAGGVVEIGAPAEGGDGGVETESGERLISR